MASIPSEKDINVFNTQDEKAAVANFFGRNLDQAESLFNENFLKYQEDLMWMGLKAFEFYVLAAINHLRSVDLNKEGDDDFAIFYSVIDFRINSEEEFKNVAKKILEKPIIDFLKFKINDSLKMNFRNFLELLK